MSSANAGLRTFRRYLPVAGLPAALMMIMLSLYGALYGALAAPPGTPAFQRTWERTDLPVRDGITARTWMWGPEANTDVLQEPYADAPGGQRNVQYFDKARMEDNSYRASEAPWDVTNGLLVVELITGRMQVGDDDFVQREPARVNVAGDADDDSGPQYATFAALLDSPPAPPGTIVTSSLDRAGNVTQDESLAVAGVTVAVIDDVTNHSIATPFWEFMNSTGTVYASGQFTTEPLFENPYFATGRPITEPYWAFVKVAGTYRDVLMQCFERRCLTYTPGNPEGFVVEAGNVGQHYYTWRYEQDSSGPAPSATPTASPTATASPSPSPSPSASPSPSPTATEEPVTDYRYESEWGSAYASIKPLQGPTGVGADPAGNYWVADTYNDRLVRFDRHGMFIQTLGGSGSGPAQFRRPKDIAFDVGGRIYVADQNNDRVQVFAPDGGYLFQWGGYGTGNGKFYSPTSIAIYNNTVYVSDRDNDRIQLFDLNGVYKGTIGSSGSGPGQLDGPEQITFDASGNLYVVDGNNSRVVSFTSTGEFRSAFGSEGSGPGQFNDPHGIAVDNEGYIYVADTLNHRIQIFDSNGQYVAHWGVAGTGLGRLQRPIGLELDREGNLLVADFANERVQKFTRDGQFLFEIRDASRGRFGALMDIAVDQNGNVLTIDGQKELYDSGSVSRFTPAGIPLDVLSVTRPERGQYDVLAGIAVNLETGDIYLTDRVTNRIQRFSSTWEYLGVWGSTGNGPGQFNGPTGIAIDADGNVYVADTMNHRIQKFDANGVFLDEWGAAGDGNGQFQQPRGITVHAGRVYVTDYGNNRVQIFDLDGSYLGQFGASGSGMGELDGPAGIAVSFDGLLLVADTGNNRIQIFSPDGEPLGAFGSAGSGPGQFNLPYQIAVGPGGFVYVTDVLNDRVQKFAPER